MNKLVKAAAAFILCAAMAFPHSPVNSAFAETAEVSDTTNETPADSSSQEDIVSKPVVVGYYITNKSGKEQTSITSGKEFNIKILVKDIGVKTSDIGGANDIDFIKSVDSFKGTLKNITVTSDSDKLLTYTVQLEGCKWSGGSTDFGFMTGYLSVGGEYSSLTFSVSECTESSSSSSGGSSSSYDSSNPEPIFRITAAEPTNPIKAGDAGTMELTLKNMGTVEAERVLVEISGSDDVLITDGTGSQDINYISSGGTKTLTIKYKALDKITSSKQTFAVSLRYYYSNGTGDSSGSASATITAASKISTVERVNPVVLSDFDLAEATLSADKEYEGVVTLKNVGTADMKGIYVNFTSSDGFVLTGGTRSSYVAALAVGKSCQIPVKIKTMPTLESLKQELSLSVKYSYIMGSEELDGTSENVFTMFSEVKPDETKDAPYPIITFSELKEPITAGHKYRYTVYIENKGETDMENVQVNIKSGEGITLIESSSYAFIEKIAAGKKKYAKIVFETAAELASPSQSLDVELSYSYTNAEKKKEQATASATLSLDSEISGAPVVRMYGEKLGSAITAKNEYEYTLTFTNYGDIPVRDVYLSFTASDSLYFVDGTEYAYIDIIRSQKSADVTVKFRTTDEITAAKQSISAQINYSYGVVNGEKQGTTEAAVTIIAAGAKEDGSSGASIAAPNIIIGSYDIGAEQIAAGDEFDLNLDFYNTSSATAVENLIMTVNAGGDINIFGGANTYFYPSLSAAGGLSETVKLKALATASTGTSSVSISFKYDYLDGENRNTVSTEQTIFIPVYQPDKMTFDVSVPTYSVYAGNEVYITTSYMNKGRSDISNVKAEIVGDVGALSTSKVIGNLVPGATGTFDFIVTPYESGDCSFTILFTYEDATLNEVSKEVPVSFYVEDMSYDYGEWDEDMYMSEETEGESGFPWIVLIIGIAVVVIAAIIVIICVVKSKKKKKSKLTEADIDWEDDLDDILSDKSDKNDKTKV
jgi:hypothetical protein